MPKGEQGVRDTSYAGLPYRRERGARTEMRVLHYLIRALQADRQTDDWADQMSDKASYRSPIQDRK